LLLKLEDEQWLHAANFQLPAQYIYVEIAATTEFLYSISPFSFLWNVDRQERRQDRAVYAPSFGEKVVLHPSNKFWRGGTKTYVLSSFD
jgi:hypothetical protein